ncbi:MAG: helix-turn-helix transcriptional regulator [Oscillospiraceae bacterium]|nr:helix-turn-helix transcriptional regulator [Oscillospiraceae bacterium]
MDAKEIFSKRLLNLREERGLSRQTAADSLQISRASLEYYEKGLRLPDVCVLAKIADYYCVSADYLLGRSEVKRIDPDKQLNIACEYTGLSEKCVYLLNSVVSKNDEIIDEKIIIDFISSFIVNLFVKKGLPIRYLEVLMDAEYLSSRKDSSIDIDALCNTAAKCGYCLFDASEVTEYWQVKLLELINSASKEAFEQTISNGLSRINKTVTETE